MVLPIRANATRRRASIIGAIVEALVAGQEPNLSRYFESEIRAALVVGFGAYDISSRFLYRLQGLIRHEGDRCGRPTELEPAPPESFDQRPGGFVFYGKLVTGEGEQRVILAVGGRPVLYDSEVLAVTVEPGRQYGEAG